ncbi:retrotransposon protein, putative, ty1-copia subclass [Tanacetum coccineum]|uniref:Retrotransposon protein, putative, ty1-copia subclass n=1 Tax=Tanacetum coccineum TaxID=301880 RepID=A0ABQ5GZV0_9ASTR
MHGMGKTIPELHAMLKLTEKGIPKKALAILAIRQVEEEQSHHVWHIRGIQKLNNDALDLYVGNGSRAIVKSIGSFDLILPSGMVLVLDNFHFAPSITIGVILLSRLWDNGFLHKYMNYGAISVSKDNLFYFNAIPRDGIFEIDMHNNVSNERSIYTCSNKKSNHNLDSNFLWYCRLGHINKKHIAKLQNNRIIKSIDNESFINTSEHQPEAEHEDVEPKTDVNPVRRSALIPQAPERYDFYIDVEEHVLGDHGEPTTIELHC